MKILILLFAACIIQQTAFAVSSTESIQFLSKEEIPFSEMGKPVTYKGLITLSDSTRYELYELSFSKPLKVDKTLCQAITKELIGSKKVIKIEIRPGHTGSVCLFEFFDPIKKQTPAHQLGLVGFIRARPIVIVTDFNQAITEEQKQESLNFWRTLR